MKLPQSVYNWTSIIGGAIALISFVMFIFLFAISLFFDQGSSYLGLFVYIVIPVFLVIGLVMIPVGMTIRIKRDKRKDDTGTRLQPYIDLNNRRHRNAFAIFIVSTTIFLFFTAIGSYEAFHYTESVEFCGTLCHKVMEPEYTAYLNSAHARVACVECHVGPGADWFVRSKLSGLYQVYAVLAGSYPKPIPTPISNLRPARETCEQCHWPEKFYSRNLKVQKHFLTDENNTEWDIILEMKIDASYSAHGLQEGIHWHINPDVKIEFIDHPDDKGIIQWVKFTNLKTNEETVYEYEDDPADPSRIAMSSKKIMDCIDCHSRPSHAYMSPSRFIDHAFTAGKLPHDLPYLKYITMELLKQKFSSTDSAFYFIDKGIRDYYRKEYADIYANNEKLISDVITTIQTEFRKHTFPEMKVRWDVYPDHISHIESNGCFRCHDGRHTSRNGKTISKDCSLCHNILGQGTPDSLQKVSFYESLQFRHPVDIGEAWQEMHCSDCHSELY